MNDAPRARAKRHRASVGALAVCVALAGLLFGGCAPAAPAAAQASGPCTVDAECSLVDVCGCECRAELGRALPPMACSEACPGRPCEGHRARCRSGVCVME